MLRAVIGDNNRADRLTLRGIINHDKELLLEGEAEDEAGLLSLVEKTIPQIVFISIDMPGINLNDMLHLIESVNHRMFIILMSSAECFSREAMDVFVFHRLFKPLDLKKTTDTINRLKSIMSSYKSPKLMPFYKETESTGMPHPQTLVINTGDDLEFIKVTDIIMITRNARKTEVHTLSGIYKVNESLEKIETRLGNNFFRSHKGYIVNANKISSLTIWGNKTYLIKLNDTKATALMTFVRFKLYSHLYCIK
jgi:DNA-binding LytR/AlgR family response regulator